MAPKCSLIFIKSILTSYALFVIYICTFHFYHRILHTTPTHLTYYTVDLFNTVESQKNELTVPFYSVSLVHTLFMVSLLVYLYYPTHICLVPVYFILHLVLTCLNICGAKFDRGRDPPVAVYLGLGLATITNIWLVYDLFNGYYDKRRENAPNVEDGVECGQKVNVQT